MHRKTNRLMRSSMPFCHPGIYKLNIICLLWGNCYACCNVINPELYFGAKICRDIIVHIHNCSPNKSMQFSVSFFYKWCPRTFISVQILEFQMEVIDCYTLYIKLTCISIKQFTQGCSVWEILAKLLNVKVIILAFRNLVACEYSWLPSRAAYSVISRDTAISGARWKSAVFAG